MHEYDTTLKSLLTRPGSRFLHGLAGILRFGWMQVRMQNVEPLTGQQIGDFLRGSEAIRFAGESRVEVYSMVQQALAWQEYFGQDRQQWEISSSPT